MTKTIQIEISGCHTCPFKEYDSNYNIGYDSGFNCMHPGTDQLRIADDGEINNKKKSLSDFPKWCPIKEPKLGFYTAEIPIEEVD